MPLTEEDRAWLNTPPVGREFGSPDYERLMELDALIAEPPANIKVFLDDERVAPQGWVRAFLARRGDRFARNRPGYRNQP